MAKSKKASRHLTISPAKARQVESERQQRVQEHAAQLAMAELERKASVRAELLERLIVSARTTIADVLEYQNGTLTVKDLTDLPVEIARAVKKCRITTTSSAEYGTTQTVQLEMAHHLEYDEKIAKYLGLYPKEPAPEVTENHLHLHNLTTDQIRDMTPAQLSTMRKRLERQIEE